MPLAPRTQAVEALLRDLGGRIRPGGSPVEPPGHLVTGLPPVDRLLGGGLPRGRLCEIVGGPCSGRTSLSLALLAATTRSGGSAAWIDLPDAFDPRSAWAAGVELSRVLWIRAPRLREALRSTERLLEARGFAGIFLDVKQTGLPPAACLRLRRRAAASGATLVLLAPDRSAETFAELAVETRSVRPCFSPNAPDWLEGLEIRIELARHRSIPPGAAAPLRLRVA